MLIRTIETNEFIRRTPEIVQIILDRFEVLFENNYLPAKKILTSFYDVDNVEYFEKPWGEIDDFTLGALKEIINADDFRVSRHTDTRILSQVLLDFLDNISGPAISEHTVDQLFSITVGKNSNDGLISDLLSNQKETEIKTKMHANMIQKVNKDEIILLSRFKQFFSLMSTAKNTHRECLDRAVNR